MTPSHAEKALILVLCIGALLVLAGIPTPARADSPDRTSVHVVVKDATTDQPISQARYKFTNSPKGTILLMVIADHHQTFGKEFEVEQDNQVIEVKLKRPQPLL
jgi:hypothetical protein